MIELKHLRKSKEKHFLKKDGTMLVYLYEDNIHYFKNNKYELINNNFIKRNNYYINKANSFKTKFNIDSDKNYLLLKKIKIF